MAPSLHVTAMFTCTAVQHGSVPATASPDAARLREPVPKGSVPLSFTPLPSLKKRTAPTLQNKTQARKLMKVGATAFPHPSEFHTKYP